MVLVLTASEMEQVADLPATIDAVEHAFRDISLGLANQPPPVSMSLEKSSDSNFVLLGGLGDHQNLAAVKLLADIPSNSERGLPTQRSAILLSNRETGEPQALLDGRVPTRVRTAAASAVASKHLARPESSTLGVIGAGALAITHVQAMLEVLPIDTVVVWSRSSTTVDAFCHRISHLGPKVVKATSAREAVEAADVLCTVTPSVEPLVKGEWFRAGLHVNAIGARPRPEHREIDSAGMARAGIFVDSMDTALKKSGDLLMAVADGSIAIQDVRAELGDVVTGAHTGRRDAADITLFNSVGIGMQDLAIGRLLFDAAMSRGIGLRVDLGR